ncbi:ABC transporter ATP-binding protein [Patescibacteria group bacterium]
MANKTPIVKTENITKVYQLGDTTIAALSGITLEIFEGELVAIIGKSGSGKSTLMHVLGLLDTPTEGIVYLNGKKVNNYSENELAKIRNKEIGFVFQSFNLLPRASALGNVMLPLQYSSISRRKWAKMAEDTLKLVELGDRLDNKSNELSGGQRQRVAIARALVTQPSLVFADEPTGNLDTKTGDEIEKLFKKLNDQGKTIVIVTHDEDLAKIAKRKIILSDGKIISDSTS